MANKTLGYARTSTQKQHEDRQIIALREYGVEEKNIFMDRKSGKDFERPEYRRMLRKLRTGDTVVFPSVDRMGRNYRLLLNEWRTLMNRGIRIIVLDMPILTRDQDQDLPGVLISDMMLGLLCFFAESEGNHIRARVLEGMNAARQRGVTFGRPRKERTPEFYRLAQEYKDGNVSARAAAQSLGISHPSFLNWVKDI